MIDLKTKLEDLTPAIKLLNTKSGFIQMMYKISHLFENVDKDILVDLLNSTNIYISLIYEVFKNESFNESLLHIMENDDDNFKAEKELINTGLRLSTFMLSNLISYLHKDTPRFLNEEFYKYFRNIKFFQEEKGTLYTISDIRSKLISIIFNQDYEYKEKSTISIDLPFFWKNLKKSKTLIITMLLISHHGESLRNAFKKFIKEQKDMEKGEKKFFLSLALFKINKTAKEINLFENVIAKEDIKDFNFFVSGFNIDSNESKASYIIEKMTDGFEFEKNKSVIDIVRAKINSSTYIKREIQCFADKSLKAYSGELADDDYEWSNKIYLITMRTLGVLESLKTAYDDEWVRKVFAREFFDWVKNVHQILNKYDIQDDWDKIQALVKQEDSRVEWKSSFFTSTESLFVSEKVEKQNCKKILSNVTKVMLGMMNTDGGIILVGLVENPEAIKRKDVKQNLVTKNNFTFFDIHYEFGKKNKNLDSLKREIQDILWNETLCTAEKFNDLWTIEPIEIKNDYSVVTIYKILVCKSKENIYGIKKEKDSVWINLTKRADGRTIKVDPREYL